MLTFHIGLECKNPNCGLPISLGAINVEGLEGLEQWFHGFPMQDIPCPVCLRRSVYSAADIKPNLIPGG